MSTGNFPEFGPLAVLIGEWQGEQGMDIAPEPDGTEKNPYFESIVYTPVGDVENGKEQVLMALRYQEIVTRKSTNKVFHDQTGYWLWDSKTNLIMHSFTIPRGMAVLAGGKVTIDEQGASVFTLSASLEDPRWSIVQSPFMFEKAKTKSFNQTVTVAGDRMQYNESTILEIYGKIFDHTDRNKLTRVK